MVFSPVEATGVTMVTAVVVGAPVGSFACVAVFAEFGADEEGVERVGGEHGLAVEDEDLRGRR